VATFVLAQIAKPEEQNKVQNFKFFLFVEVEVIQHVKQVWKNIDQCQVEEEDTVRGSVVRTEHTVRT
jgi:hypothetical protein